MEIKPKITTAVWQGKNFAHFGISQKSAILYGKKSEDIVNVEISLSEDQTVPPAPQDDPKVNEPDYWAWWDNEKEKFTLIWPKRFLLNMCFAYGMKAEEDIGRGKDYRVHVKQM